MTDESRPAEPQPAADLPQNGGALPRRTPAGEPPPHREPSAQDESLPRRDPLPQRDALPRRDPLPQADQFGQVSRSPGSFFERAVPSPDAELPKRAAPSEPLPQRGGEPLPQRGAALPQRGGEPLPQRGEQRSGLGALLPRRTTRTRRAGRHRSSHRLSVGSDAPALVLAVPGTAAADTTEIGPQVAAIAAQSCPGVDIRVGYLDGSELGLADSLRMGEADSKEPDQFPSVIVPLLLSPNPAVDTRLQQAAEQPKIPAIVAPHLGPHPLIAEALHARLADAGLARQARSAGLSISADGRGIVVLADIGEEASSGAAVAAVLLASRLSVPVVPASLGDPSSIVDAVNRLSESGAARPVLSPCLIGPETNVAVLEDLSAALGAPCAPVLGAHQAIGQLVAIRYGAALASLSLAG